MVWKKLTALLVSLSLASGAMAQQQNPYSRGTGKRITGYILIPAGSVLGGIYFLGGAFGESACDEDSILEDKKNCRSSKVLMYTGLGLVAASVITGIILIRSGNSDRRRWQKWEDQNRNKTSHLFDLKLMAEGPALSYEYKF